MKKTAIIGSAGIPARYGGFETLTENLVFSLHEKCKFIVFCSKKFIRKNDLPDIENVEYFILPLSPNGLSSIFYDLISMFIAVFMANRLLVLGCSAGFAVPFFRLFKKIIFHPDGLEWKRDRWNFAVKTYLKISNRMACKGAHHLIIDNKALADTWYNRYTYKSDIIEYGGNHIQISINHQIDMNHFLMITRAVPENNLEIICKTFLEMPDKDLLIVCNYTSSIYGRYLFNTYNACPNISFLDSIYDNTELNQIRSERRIYIHGHSSGGTNPSLVEAMWSGSPVICHDNIFNRHTTRDKALYFSDSESLKYIITNTKMNILESNAENMNKIALSSYTWEKISHKYGRVLL